MGSRSEEAHDKVFLFRGLAANAGLQSRREKGCDTLVGHQSQKTECIEEIPLWESRMHFLDLHS